MVLVADPEDSLVEELMAFLRALTETVSTVPHVSMLVVMINSEKDPTTLQGDGEARRQDLQAYLQRNGQTKPVNENADFTAILRRRLFANSADMAVDRAAQQSAEAFRPVMNTATGKRGSSEPSAVRGRADSRTPLCVRTRSIPS